jgi:Domain of unknown function (DUF4282)
MRRPTMGEYLAFRRMITPVFIQVIFWVAVLAIVIAALVQIADGSAIGGLLILIFGPLFARIYAEILIVIFRINDNVAGIRQQKTTSATAETPPLS